MPCAQCCDQYFVKYAATVVAMLVYAAPLWLRPEGVRGSRDDLTQDYIRAMRLLQNTSRYEVAARLAALDRDCSNLRMLCPDYLLQSVCARPQEQL